MNAFADVFEARESLASRLMRVACVVGLQAGVIALLLTLQPRVRDEAAMVRMDVRTVAEEIKPPPPPPKVKVEPPKPLPQAARQPVAPPPPLPPVMTAAANVEPAPSSFAVAPQPAPQPPAPPAPVAAAAPVVAAPPPPTPAPVTAARFDADYLKNPPPAYPPLSRRMREEGKVLLSVRVSPQGAAESVQVRQSSGFPRLDEAALEAVRHWRFVPARRGEETIAASVIVPLVFRLDS
jgi:periplasmic protein TonB